MSELKTKYVPTLIKDVDIKGQDNSCQTDVPPVHDKQIQKSLLLADKYT